jgi:hypothetical protein
LREFKAPAHMDESFAGTWKPPLAKAFPPSLTRLK